MERSSRSAETETWGSSSDMAAHVSASIIQAGISRELP